RRPGRAVRGNRQCPLLRVRAMAPRSFSPKCGQCGERAVALTRLDSHATPVEPDGRPYAVRVADLAVPRCGNCGTVVLDHEANERIDAALRRAARLLTPAGLRG